MLERLKAIAAHPFAGHPNVKPLRGEANAFRLRQGGWRALYRIDRAAQELRVPSEGLPMNDAVEITPIAETTETVTLRRADYQALLEALEDAADVVALREAEAAVQRGESELLPIEMVERLLAGESPVRVWRSYRGMTAHELAKIADLAPSYLSEIETGKKPGSFDAMARLAHALGVAMEDLAPADVLDAEDGNRA